MPFSRVAVARLFISVTALGLGGAACRGPSVDEGPLPSASPVVSVAPAPLAAPSPESAAFPNGKSLLSDLPALELLPKNVSVVVALRSPLAYLASLANFNDASASLAQAVDDLAKVYGQDLPRLAELSGMSVDVGRSFGLVAFDPRFDTLALFASVRDEAAAKGWLEARAKAAGEGRKLVVSDDALIFPSRSGVGPAVVLRKGHVFFFWTRPGAKLDPARLTSAVERVATGKADASLASDAALATAMAALAWGQDATIYVPPGQVVDLLLAEHRRVIDPAPGTAKERHEQEIAAALAPLKDTIGSVALGVELSERGVKMKAFLQQKGAPMPLSRAPTLPLLVLDPTSPAGSVFQAVVDPTLLGVVVDVVSRAVAMEPLPTGLARGRLRAFGVASDGLDVLLDSELATAVHGAKGESGGGKKGAKPERFTVVWKVKDSGALLALLEKAWTVQERTGAVRRSLAKRLGEGSYELSSAEAGALPVRLRLADAMLMVTTEPALADTLSASKPAARWLSETSSPELVPLAAIPGPTAILALGHLPWDPSPPKEVGVSMIPGGMVGGPGVEKSEAEREAEKRREEQEQRLSETEGKIRELERAQDAHARRTFRAFAADAGQVACLAKPTEGGVMIYGQMVANETATGGLVEAWLGAWLAAVPRWEKLAELTRLREQARELEATLHPGR